MSNFKNFLKFEHPKPISFICLNLFCNFTDFRSKFVIFSKKFFVWLFVFLHWNEIWDKFFGFLYFSHLFDTKYKFFVFHSIFFTLISTGSELKDKFLASTGGALEEEFLKCWISGNMFFEGLKLVYFSSCVFQSEPTQNSNNYVVQRIKRILSRFSFNTVKKKDSNQGTKD